MAEPIMPNFAEPGSYLRYYGESVTNRNDTTKKIRYIHLLEGEKPQRYPYKFSASLAVDAKSSQFTFNDLDVALGHIEQIFLCVPPGLRVALFLPFDTRLLRWDTSVTAISDDQTAVITHGLSPFEAPQFDFWVQPNKNYPSMIVQNASADLLRVPGGKSILPFIMFVGATFRSENVIEGTDEFDMLMKRKIPSKPITFGGSIRLIPK